MLFIAFTLFFPPALAAAALYPTSPANDTIFHPGMTQRSMIKWIDDSTEPPANQLGDMRIELMLGNTVIATLGTKVSSSHLQFKAHIPWGVGPDSSDYAIVFIPPVPFDPIYSARFTISNYTSTTVSVGVSAANATSAAPLPASKATATSDAVQFASSCIANPTLAFQPGAEKIGTTENGSHRTKIESPARFKALYVLWPALVGMALVS